MRIQKLTISRYGHFREVELPLEGDGVQMILGPNEAGKSTLLQFVRELLFGFPQRTPYAFAATTKDPVRGGASLILRDGSRVELTRRKGIKNTFAANVEGRDAPLSEAGFAALLGGASETLFGSVFAFALKELVEGEKGLTSQDVTSALYGGGNYNAKKTLEALDAEAAKLYTDRSKKMVIDERLKELANLASQIKEKSLRGDDFDRRRRELAEAEAEAQAATAELLSATRDRDHKKKLAEALPHWIELDRLKRERAELTAPEGFPADGLARFNAIDNDITRLERERDEAREAVEAARRNAAEVRFDPRLIDRRAAIDGLYRTIESIKEAREQLPIKQRKRDEANQAASDQLAALLPNWSPDDLRAHRPTAAQSARVERLSRQRAEREKAIKQQADKRDGHRETLRDKEAELRALGEPIDAAPLAALLEAEADYKTNLEALNKLEKERRKANRDLANLLPRLNPPLESPSADAALLPAPPREAVDQARRDLSKIDQKIESSEFNINKDEEELAALEAELAALDAKGADLPSRETLEALRNVRDDAWKLIRRKYADGEDVEDEARAWLAAHAAGAAADLMDAHPVAVREADRHADALFDRADAVAKKARIQTARDQLDRDRRALDALKNDREAALAAWRTLWSGCGFEPLAPEAMAGWLVRLDELRTLRAASAEHEQEERVLRDRVEAFETRLRAHINEPKSDTSTLLAAVHERERAARSAEQSRVSLRRDCLRETERADEAESRRLALQKEETAWSLDWRALLEELRLPNDWDVEFAVKAFNDLQNARDDLDEADAFETEADAYQARLDEFEREVRELVLELAPDLTDQPTEFAAAALQNRSTESAEARERKEGNEERLDDAIKRSAKIDADLEAARAARADLLAAVGVDSAEAFRAVAATAARVGQLDQDIQAKQREFDIIREREPLDEFIASLESADQALLDLQRVEAEERWKQLDERREAAHREVGSRDQALKELQRGSDEAALLQEQLEFTRPQLAADIDRYVPLVFARTLLKRAIDKFERESQPEMLRATSRIFSTMTAGRYPRVERPEEAGGPLLVRRADDKILEPSELSTGSREQLFLAVRLAYVLHYCVENEPLPVVMDDVMANFDDKRARNTLRALGEISKNVQVIMFTCHHHFIDIGREVFPDLRPVEVPAAAVEIG